MRSRNCLVSRKPLPWRLKVKSLQRHLKKCCSSYTYNIVYVWCMGMNPYINFNYLIQYQNRIVWVRSEKSKINKNTTTVRSTIYYKWYYIVYYCTCLLYIVCVYMCVNVILSAQAFSGNLMMCSIIHITKIINTKICMNKTFSHNIFLFSFTFFVSLHFFFSLSICRHFPWFLFSFSFVALLL